MKTVPDNFVVKFMKQKIPVRYVQESRIGRKIIDEIVAMPAQLMGFDTETCADPKWRHDARAALDPLKSHIRLVQLYDGKQVWVFDCHTFKEGATALRAIFYHHRFVAHYALFDLQFLNRAGICPTSIGCTMLMFRLLMYATTPHKVKGSLESLTKELLKEDIKKGLQDSNWGRGKLTYEQIEYAAKDPIACYELAKVFAPRIHKLGLERVYNLWKEAQYPIAEMMLAGVRVHRKRHVKLLKQWNKLRNEAKARLVKVMKGVNVNSPAAVAKWIEKQCHPDVLADWPRNEPNKRNPNGQIKVDANTLVEYGDLPFIKPFAEYQVLKKLTSTYGSKLLTKINPDTRRIHGSFTIAGARTGRMSASEPNLQQLPRPSKGNALGNARRSIIAEKGNVLVRADFNQIELRVAGNLSRDPEILRAYEKGLDLHRKTAATVTGKKQKDVTEEERQFGKSLGFGLIFGIGAAKFVVYAKKGYGVDIDEQAAHEAKKKFFGLYSGYRQWMKEQTENAEVNLLTQTACGMKRKLDEEKYYGQALNTPVQGSAAECMLYALVGMRKKFAQNGLKSARIVNVVHDEVLVECSEAEAKKVKHDVEEAMFEGYLEVFPSASVGNLVAVNIGKNWAEAK